MRRASLLALAAAGCGFHAGGGVVADDGAPAHDAPPVIVDAPPDSVLIVDAPQPVDAQHVDVDAAPGCPSSYDIDVGTDSRYRLQLAAGGGNYHPDDAYDACNGDAANGTHLAAIDDFNELSAVNQYLFAHGGTAQLWVGGTQLRNQIDCTTGWLSITGGSLYPGWAIGDPNDADFPLCDEDNGENFAVLVQGALKDVNANHSYGYLCECDGKAVALGFADAFDANNP